MKLGRSYLSVKEIKKLIKEGWVLSIYGGYGSISEISFFLRDPAKGPHCGRGFSYMCGNPCPQERLRATLLNCLMAEPTWSIEFEHETKKPSKGKQSA